MPSQLSAVNLRQTDQRTQSRPDQVKNNAGGYVFQISDMARLHRFLTIGVEGGTYYSSAKKVTQENAQTVLALARTRTSEVVEQVVAVSQAGRAPKNTPALFALAACAQLGDDAGRKAALQALPLVARTGTHLFEFVGFSKQLGGSGRGLRRALGDWYTKPDVDKLAYQLVKYRQRDGWTHRDVLRLARPKPTGELSRGALIEWTLGKQADGDVVPSIVKRFEKAQKATTAAGWTKQVVKAGGALSWEMLPDAALREPEVWEALLEQGVPMTALMRQLPRLTRLGVLAPMSATLKLVTGQLADASRLQKARVHPVNVLVALKTYASGRSVRGSSTWTPVPQVIDALDKAFYAAFGAVEPTGKKTMLALDVSGSMGHPAGDLPVSCREVATAMALVAAAVEPQHLLMGFTSTLPRSRYSPWNTGGLAFQGSMQELMASAGISPLPISPRQRLDDAVKAVADLPFGGTDCALPMVWALKNKVEVETFVVYTDNETWAGTIQPHQALREYRSKMGIDARLAVVALTPTEFSIADPTDPGMLDISGFDSAVPSLLSDFGAGRI